MPYLRNRWSELAEILCVGSYLDRITTLWSEYFVSVDSFHPNLGVYVLLAIAQKAINQDDQNHVFPHCLTLMSTQKVVSSVGKIVWFLLFTAGSTVQFFSSKQTMLHTTKNPEKFPV